jgi:hypothetical protein
MLSKLTEERDDKLFNYPEEHVLSYLQKLRDRIKSMQETLKYNHYQQENKQKHVKYPQWHKKQNGTLSHTMAQKRERSQNYLKPQTLEYSSPT